MNASKFVVGSVVCGIVWLLIGATTTMRAQNVNGTLTGVVGDADGSSVAGAAVVLRQNERELQREVVSDDAGQFRLSGLPPGSYDLEVSKEGFAVYRRERLEVLAGDARHIDVALQLAGVSEAVTVTEQLDELSRARNSASRGGTFTGREMTDLPVLSGGVSRNYRTQVFLLPGVAPARVAHAPFSFNGLRSTNTVNVMVDGADYNNPYTGSLAGTGFTEQPISQEALTNVEVQTNSYKAEYGRAAGGTINLVTQSGTNEFHGKLYNFLRNDALDARNALLQQRQPLKRNQFGGALGGRIIKDRLFFFVSGEGLVQRASSSSAPRVTFTEAERARAVAAVRPLLDLYPLPNVAGTTLFNFGDQNLRQTGRWFLGKLDYVVNNQNSLNFRASKADQLGGSSASEFAQTQTCVNDNRSYVLSLASSLSPNVFNEARVYYTGRNPTCVPDVRFLGDENINGVVGLITITGAERAGSLFRNYSQLHNYQASNDVSATIGRHGLKFGAVVRRIQQNTTDGSQVDGQLIFDSREAFLQGRPRTYTRVLGDTRLDQRATELAAYAQTDYRVLPNLNFNLGLRYELYTPPVDKYDRLPVNYDTDYNNFAPRFGFSYSPRHEGRLSSLVVRGGYGIFHTPLPMRYLADTRFTPPRVQTFTFIAPTFPNLLAGQGLLNSNLTITDTELAQPYAQQYNLTTDYRLPGSQIVLSVGYVGTRGSKFGISTLPNGGDRLAQNLRPDPTLGVVRLLQTSGSSNYNSLQTTLRGQFTSRLNVRLAYTYSKAIDDISSDSANFINQNNRRLDRGISDFDLRHNFSTAVLWDIPNVFEPSSKLSRAFDGWQLSTIITARSGFPYSILSGTETPDGSFVNRINDVPNSFVRTSEGSFLLRPANGLTLTNLRAQVTPARGQVGTLGRNTENFDAFRDVSLGIHKNIPLTERVRTQLRAEVFNLFNTTNYETVINTITDPRFGQAASAAPARAVQLAVRFEF